MENVLGQRRQSHGRMDFKDSAKGSHTDGHLISLLRGYWALDTRFVKSWIYFTMSLNVIGVLPDLGLRIKRLIKR